MGRHMHSCMVGPLCLEGGLMHICSPKVLAAVCLTLAMALSPVVTYAGPSPETDAILQSAESFFMSMKQKNYAAIWKYLSAKSRATIADDVNKRAKSTYSREQIEADFSIGGLIAKAYWDEYLFQFDPDAVLVHSKWEMGPVARQQAEIILQHRKAESPARLKMFKEENHWKVGLIETFGLERRDKPRW
jgi:hypothetical protein